MSDEEFLAACKLTNTEEKKSRVAGKKDEELESPSSSDW